MVDRFFSGEVRVRGSEVGGVSVRILELSPTTGKYSSSLITFQFLTSILQHYL